MKELLKTLKKEISKLSQNKEFIHHNWFLKYHLELVEKISLELYELYSSEADFDLIVGLIWIHDYGKIVGITEDKEVIEKSKELLTEIGFKQEYLNKVTELLEIFESKMSMDLSEAPIEVKIVSTADGVSHMYGPFYQIYCYENPELSIEELMESNLKKLEKDWDRKIVIPEVKAELEDRYNFLKESFGVIPDEIFRETPKS